MNVAVVIALVSASLAIYVALLSLRFSAAPGWGDQRWFSAAAFTASAYSLLDVSSTVAAPAVWAIWCSRFQMIVGGAHVYSWIRYSDVHLEVRAGRIRSLVETLPLLVGACGLVPGLVFIDAIRLHSVATLGVTYRDVVATPFGDATLIFQVVALIFLVVRYALAWRRGVKYAGMHCLALGYLTAIVANDTMAASGILPTPYLIDVGFVIVVVAVAHALTSRFTGDARALAELRDRLELLVDERTLELARAQAQVAKSEKLAALGRFASRVAHGVTSPAAAAISTLRYVQEARSRSDADGNAWPEDTGECLEDAIHSIERITQMMQGFRNAGHLANNPATLEPVQLSLVARESLRAAQARCGERVSVSVEVDEEVRALAQEGPLIQVLTTLIANGIEAIPGDRADGHVTIRCHRLQGRLHITVHDNGVGLPPHVLQYAFEPFFSTKPHGVGTGLAVSRVIVQSLGGDLRLESAAGTGTSAVVELCEAKTASA
jgi:signal transduction histidine kinase